MKCPHCGIHIPPWRPDWWSPQREARLLELVPTVSTIGALAAKLGATRNSVIGKLARLRRQGRLNGVEVGWKLHPQPKRKPPMPTKTKPPEPSYAVKSVGNRIQHAQQRRGPDGLRLQPQFPMRRLTLLELRVTTCRWPIGRLHEPARWFCGNDCDPERPYCAPHHAFAHHHGGRP